MKRVQVSITGTIAAILVEVSFGVNSNIVKLANVNNIQTINVIFYQFLIGLIYFTLRFFVTTEKNTLALMDLVKNPFNYLAGITTALTGIGYYFSIKITNPSIASIGLFQFPWILFFFGVFFNKETYNLKHIITIISLWFGTLILVGTNMERLNFIGGVWGIIAGISFATNIFTLPKTSNHSLL
ncbi:TPA: EamA family transporter [Staphylococcus aureus]|nr:EamA family transporter [Staphylococcus aureus]